MPLPHSYRRHFAVNGVEFVHHFAQDGHGSRAETYYVNDRVVTPVEFFESLQKAVGDAEYYISMACGLNKIHTPDWGKRG